MLNKRFHTYYTKNNFTYYLSIASSTLLLYVWCISQYAGSGMDRMNDYTEQIKNETSQQDSEVPLKQDGEREERIISFNVTKHCSSWLPSLESFEQRRM